MGASISLLLLRFGDRQNIERGLCTVNKNIIVLIVLGVVLAALVYFYAYPQWRKYHPKPVAVPTQPGPGPAGPGPGN